MILTDEPSLENLVNRAVAGDRDAVAGLVRAIQDKVYALALRMLWRREEAEDATQEILVRVVTRLGQFVGRSRVETWVYRVATNYLIDVKRSCVERQALTFETLADDLVDGLAEGPADYERAILVEEVRIGCTLAMLQCLDRPHRLAYVLGEIFELPALEAAAALELEPVAFRKRLQRAREAVESFTRAHCGLVSGSAHCQCNRRVTQAIRLGRVHIDRQDFATGTTSFGDVRHAVQQVEHAKRTLAMYQASRPMGLSVDFVQRVVSALDLDLGTTTTNPGRDGTGC